MIVTIKDLLLDEVTTSDLKNNYSIKDNIIRYIENDSVVTIEYYEDKLYLTNKGKTILDLYLEKGKKTSCKLYNDFGIIQMYCFCELLLNIKNSITFQYRLLQNDQVVTHKNVSIIIK